VFDSGTYERRRSVRRSNIILHLQESKSAVQTSGLALQLLKRMFDLGQPKGRGSDAPISSINITPACKTARHPVGRDGAASYKYIYSGQGGRCAHLGMYVSSLRKYKKCRVTSNLWEEMQKARPLKNKYLRHDSQDRDRRRRLTLVLCARTASARAQVLHLVGSSISAAGVPGSCNDRLRDTRTRYSSYAQPQALVLVWWHDVTNGRGIQSLPPRD